MADDQIKDLQPDTVVEGVKETAVNTAADTTGELVSFGVQTAKNELGAMIKENATIKRLVTDVEGAVSTVSGIVEDVKGAYNDVKDDLPPEAQESLGVLEDYAEQKAKEKADEKKEEMQKFAEEKVSSIIQETGLGPEDSEKIIALAKDGCPDEETKGFVSDATKKALT